MRYQLLVMDDSVTIRRVVELTFAGGDVQVVSVGDGRAALERIAAEPPDVILADVGTAQPDGYEIAASVKSNPALAHIPVLLLSGAFQPIDQERARASGCDGVLAKPFEPDAVVARVRQVLQPSPGAPVAGAEAADHDEGAVEKPEPVEVAGGPSPEGEEVLAFLERLLAETSPEEAGAPAGRLPTLPSLHAAEETRAVTAALPDPCSLDDYFDLVDEVLARLGGGRAAAPRIPRFPS
jgi:CheY-like chemotaxis protein